MFKLSVIICTHNPKEEYINRTLKALRHQLRVDHIWELLIIDNKSKVSLADLIDLSWHPNARIIREDQLGLTPARLRGIAESNAELLVFVDDDNILDPNYLFYAEALASEFPFIGAFGGSIEGEFEVNPPQHLLKYLHYIAVRKVEKDVWSNLYEYKTTPVGAGMVIRRAVAERYAALTHADPNRKLFDRVGDSLNSAGDIDMAFTAIDMGLGCGLFKKLVLHHIIPAGRLSDEYILKLYKSNLISTFRLDSVRGIYKPVSRKNKGILQSAFFYYNFYRHFSSFERKKFQLTIEAEQEIAQFVKG